MKKIDRETFEFQMRLIKAEMKVEELKEKNEYLERRIEIQNTQITYGQQYNDEQKIEIESLKKFINKFINPQG